MAVKHQLLVILLLTCAAALTRRADTSLTPALFIFGDSTVDTGNQDYITSVIKSNFPPYGQNFTPPGPTGRFSNGKLPGDLLADYLGLPFPVNYLSPDATGSALLTGVNMASAGSGYLDVTNQPLGVVNLTMQLDNFLKVQASIVGQIGQPAATELFAKSLFVVSTGSNDFATITGYDINPIEQRQYTPAQFQQLVIDSVTGDLQRLYDMGARIVGVDSLGPIGCAPFQLLYGNSQGKCVDSVNAVCRNFNSALQGVLNNLRASNPGYQLLYANIYDNIYNIVQDPASGGFTTANMACCGEGNFKGLPCANPISDLCDNVDDYVFWDFFHPTQKLYQVLAQGFIYGGPEVIYPNNLQTILNP